MNKNTVSKEIIISAKKIINKLQNKRSFSNKRILLTISIPPNTRIDSLKELIENLKTGFPKLDKTSIKLAKKTLVSLENYLGKKLNLLQKGSVIFTGYSKEGGKEKFYLEVFPRFIKEYNTFCKGYFDNKFKLKSLKEFLIAYNNIEHKKDLDQINELLERLEKEHGCLSSRYCIGFSFVKDAITKKNAKEILISEELKNFISCPNVNCGVKLLKGTTQCSYCNYNIEKETKSQYSEISELAKKNQIPIYTITDKQPKKLFDNKYSGIACLKRY